MTEFMAVACVSFLLGVFFAFMVSLIITELR